MATKDKNTDLNKDPQEYEVSYLLVPTIGDSEVSSVSENIRKAIEKADGKINSEDAPVERELAYEMIKHVAGKNHRFNRAYFGSLRFEVGPESISEIKKFMDSDLNVLRFLIVKPDSTEVSVANSGGDEIEKEVEVTEEEVKPKEVVSDEIDKSIEELVTQE